nr:unnamed protein product [Callosobruchus analis]
MSFGKAKRFNYKEPDLKVSPADYNITSSYDKGCSIPKCPRFRCKQNSDATSSGCRCSNTTKIREVPQQRTLFNPKLHESI